MKVVGAAASGTMISGVFSSVGMAAVGMLNRASFEAPIEAPTIEEQPVPTVIMMIEIKVNASIFFMW